MSHESDRSGRSHRRQAASGGGGLATIVLIALIAGCGGKPPAPRPLDAETDRAVVFSTFLGGSDSDEVRALDVDAPGNVYVAGGTRSGDFPASPGAARTRNAGGMDVFVAKFDPEGRRVWATLLGGPGHDRAYAVRVAKDGGVVVAGRAGAGFPVSAATAQPGFAGDADAIEGYGTQDGFVARLSPDGARVDWATYVGEAGRGVVRDMDVDDEGAAYVALNEASGSCAHVAAEAYQRAPGGGRDSLVAKIAADGSRVVWATWLGGSGTDNASSIRVARDGAVIVAGGTDSADFPTTAGAAARKIAGDEDAFVTAIAPDGRSLRWSTLLGGSRKDGAAGVHGLALDPRDGTVVVTGYTHSEDFPATAGVIAGRIARRADTKDPVDLFVAKLAPDGSRWIASTFLGGSDEEVGEGIGVDAAGRIHLSANTRSRDFPIPGATAANPTAGAEDALAIVVAPDLSGIERVVRLGGGAKDSFRACAVDPLGGFALGGGTSSADWPVKAAFQALPAGRGEAVVVRLHF